MGLNSTRKGQPLPRTYCCPFTQCCECWCPCPSVSSPCRDGAPENLRTIDKTSLTTAKHESNSRACTSGPLIRMRGAGCLMVKLSPWLSPSTWLFLVSLVSLFLSVKRILSRTRCTNVLDVRLFDYCIKRQAAALAVTCRGTIPAVGVRSHYLNCDKLLSFR